MKIVRCFLRADPTDIDAYTLRMDSLLAAHPGELLEFVADAVTSLAARVQGKDDPLEWALGSVREVVTLDGSDRVVRLASVRWEQVVAVLGEHASWPEVGDALARISREAPWE